MDFCWTLLLTLKCFKQSPQPYSLTRQAAAVTNSASVVDKVTIYYFFEDHDIAPELIVKTKPDVLFLSSRSPA